MEPPRTSIEIRGAGARATVLLRLGFVRAHAYAGMAGMFAKAEQGALDTHEYRIQAVDPKTKGALSLWHNVPLFDVNDAGEPTGCLNFICEIPKWRVRTHMRPLSSLTPGAHCFCSKDEQEVRGRNERGG